MKKRSNIKVMLSLVGLVKPLILVMLVAIFMGVLGNIAASIITILGGAIFVNLLDEANSFPYDIFLIIIFAAALLRGVLRYAEQASNHYIAFKLLALLRDKVYKKLRALAPAKLEGRNKGDLISIITSDIELLEVFYAHTISPIFIAIIFSTIFAVVIFSYNIYLGLLSVIAYIFVGFIVPVIMSKLNNDDGLLFRSKAGKLSSIVLDNLRGISETMQYGSHKKSLDDINKMTEELTVVEERMKINVGVNNAVTNAVILFFDFAMFFASAYLYMNESISFSAVVICTLTMMSTFGPSVALAALGSTLQNTIASGNRVLDILEEEPIIADIENKENTVYKDASFKNVSFAYDKVEVVDDISLEIPNGKIIGIVGKSGSGKSTLLKLLMRFWEVDKGNIEISGKNIKDINTSDLRNMQSFVTQETYLFQGSIAENLKIAKLDATDEEIYEACKKASVHDFIMILPQGYDTKVGELGDTLSGGERQRIGLARAFLHDADLMLLDEPTSNLDSLNEAQILKSLHEREKGKSVIIVSHRDSTMKIADKVYSANNGRVS